MMEWMVTVRTAMHSDMDDAKLQDILNQKDDTSSEEEENEEDDEEEKKEDEVGIPREQEDDTYNQRPVTVTSSDQIDSTEDSSL